MISYPLPTSNNPKKWVIVITKYCVKLIHLDQLPSQLHSIFKKSISIIPMSIINIKLNVFHQVTIQVQALLLNPSNDFFLNTNE